MVEHDRRNTNGLDYDNDFWRFSLAVYGQADVAMECLALQDKLGIDVNMLLFCAWLGTRAVVLTHEDLKSVSGIVATWHENVVRPLRAVREQTKTLSSDKILRASIKGVEIRAEQIEQAILFATSSRLQSSSSDVDRNEAVAQNVKDYIAMKIDAFAMTSAGFTADRLIDATFHFLDATSL